MFMLKKYIKQYRMGYKGYIPPKHPICINFQMPIYQNNKILLYILRGSKVKGREISDQYFSMLNSVANYYLCGLSEDICQFRFFSIFPFGSKSKLVLKKGQFFNGT